MGVNDSELPENHIKQGQEPPPKKKGSKKTRIKKASTPESKERTKTAQYLVRKYVKPDKVTYPRDIIIAYKLVDKYPEITFWESLECKFQLNSMAILWSEQSRNKLKYAYQRYSEKINLHNSIAIPEKETYILNNEKIGEDFKIKIKKPKNILEFCKKAEEI